MVNEKKNLEAITLHLQEQIRNSINPRRKYRIFFEKIIEINNENEIPILTTLQHPFIYFFFEHERIFEMTESAKIKKCLDVIA